MFWAFNSHSQSFEVSSLVSNLNKKVAVTGQTTELEGTNNPLAFVTVMVKELAIETETNLDGSFHFKLPAGTYTFIYSFIGYCTKEKKVTIPENHLFTLPKVVLKPKSLKTNPSLELAKEGNI